METTEVWKDCVGYEGLYRVSDKGRIYSVRKHKIMHDYLNRDGYKKVLLITESGKRKEERVHRLVATAFIPNPDNLPCINHKDENKLNNYAENLEWCTVQYNTSYSSYKWTGANNGMNKPGVREKHLKAIRNRSKSIFGGDANANHRTEIK